MLIYVTSCTHILSMSMLMSPVGRILKNGNPVENFLFLYFLWGSFLLHVAMHDIPVFTLVAIS